MDHDNKLKTALDILRRLPPQSVVKHLQDIIQLQPSLCEELLSAANLPLKVSKDVSCGKEYLCCDYNRDGDSFRSPWSNLYDPPIDDGLVPSKNIRDLEIKMNAAFNVYRSMYFDGGVSSVYLWETDVGFNGAILIKKSANLDVASGCWDSIHVVEVEEKDGGRSARYKLITTVMLWLTTKDDSCGMFNLGGSLTREIEKEFSLATFDAHLNNLGPLIEDHETRMRTLLNDVYFGTSKNIVDSMRSLQAGRTADTRNRMLSDLQSAQETRLNRAAAAASAASSSSAAAAATGHPL